MNAITELLRQTLPKSNCLPAYKYAHRTLAADTTKEEKYETIYDVCRNHCIVYADQPLFQETDIKAKFSKKIKCPECRFDRFDQFGKPLQVIQ